MTTQQRTETDPTTYPKRVRVPRGRVTHAARIMDTDAVFTACATYYGHEIEPRWQDDDAEVTCRACIKAEARREREAPEQQAPQHEVTRSLELADAEGDDEVWDEPRTEVTADELFTLRAGVVVEAKTVQGTRCRLRLDAAPTTAHEGAAYLEGPKAELYEVERDSVTVIGVMPRKGDTIHAQARTYRDVGGERVIGLSPVMRRKLDRDPWPGGDGNTVVSDGRGVDAVLTSTIVILAEPAEGRDDEQRIARVVSLAMPGLDFHTNTTSVSAIRVYANRAEGEGRDDEAVLGRNDDIAEAIVRAGFYVSRRGVGQAVYASVERSSHAHADGMCEVDTHKGERAPWIAVLSSSDPFKAPYACRDCVRWQVESERALDHADPARPYIVRMWDTRGRTLKVADDPTSLDFRGVASRDEARTMAEQSPAEGWRHEQGGRQLVPVHRVTVDRAVFFRDGDLRRVEMILATGVRPISSETDDCTCVEFCDEDPRTKCSLSGRPHVHPASQGPGFGPCPIHPERDGDH